MLHFSRALSLAAAASCFCGALLAAQAAPAAIAGVVRDQAGNPVTGAEVRVEGTTSRTVTDMSGAFALRGEADSLLLSVRRLGFKPRALVVTRARASRVEVSLEATPQQLAVVTVSARPEVFESRLTGFYDRARKGSGSFVTRESLDRLTSGRLTDALREVPGVRFGQTQSRGVGPRSVRLRGANCPPLVFVDGFPANAGEFDLDLVDPWTVEGMEIYHGISTVPAEFLAARGGERCGVVAIWSRPYRPLPRRRQSGKPVTVADLVAKLSVYTADDVDLSAVLKAGTATPSYPDSLFQNGVTGRVLTEFVVDTSGYVETETVGIVSSTHASFSAAAILALRQAAFQPALKNGRPVRQVAQLPFVFEPKRPAQAQKP